MKNRPPGGSKGVPALRGSKGVPALRGSKGVFALDKAGTALLPLPKAGTPLLLQNDFFSKIKILFNERMAYIICR